MSLKKEYKELCFVKNCKVYNKCQVHIFIKNILVSLKTLAILFPVIGPLNEIVNKLICEESWQLKEIPSPLRANKTVFELH